jgi:hypothetical protein
MPIIGNGMPENARCSQEGRSTGQQPGILLQRHAGNAGFELLCMELQQ